MKKSVFVFAIFLAATVSGCSNVKQQLGVGRNSPDEFSVVKRAPLTLPPEYTLRPPAEGDLPAASEVSAQAKATMMGAPTSSPKPIDNAEEQLLSKMGATSPDPGIRSQINRENGYIALENETLAEKLIFWKEPNVSDEKIPSSIVNASEETDRIKKNQSEGKPVTEGNVPVIEKKKGTIDKLF